MPSKGAAGKAGTVEMPSKQPQDGSVLLKPSGGGKDTMATGSVLMPTKASTKSSLTAEE